MKNLQHTMKKPWLLILLIGFLALGIAPLTHAQETKPELEKEKQTTLELYVTSKEAYGKWKAAPEQVSVIDVRTPEEYYYIGHAEMAWNIPLFFQSYEWDAEKKHFPMNANDDFVKKVMELFQPDDIILITCRSGARSAMATNKLAAAGFKNIYNITDGFEGDKVKDANSVFAGERMVNGWKNSGLPYTYKIDPDLMPFVEKK